MTKTDISIQVALTDYLNYLKTTLPLKKAQVIFNLTVTAITRYTAPGFGCPAPSGRKPTKAEKEKTGYFLETTPVEKMENAVAIQASVFDKVNATRPQRDTYGSKLKNFVDWLRKQHYIGVKREALAKNNRSPRIRHGHGGLKPLKETNSTLTKKDSNYQYRLYEHQMSDFFKCQLVEFYKFMTDFIVPKRSFERVRSTTMNDVIGGLYRLLGWYSSANNILPETITIETVVPKPKKTKKGREEDSEIIERIACDYLNFLQSRGVKPRTLLCSIKPIHYLIRYQYRDCTKDARYKDIPAMVAIQQRMNEIDRVLRKQTKPSSDSDMKWLDLPQVITQIVEPLRKECAAHTCCGAKRSVSAIAKSFQRYVAWGLMCYRPPRRQGEFRQAKIWANAYCDLETGQLIQPLPPAHLRDRCHSYFHKKANGFWYLDVPREASKTGDTFGDQDLIIENIQFPDGKTFYDYIEGFLYGVCIDSKGNWNAHSLFQGKHLDLRMEFNPKCDNFFVYPHNGGAYDRTSFMLIFKETAHRLTGKPINPHLLRDIYATWYLDNGHTPERITSLAYAMAHSEKTLREIYDRRHSQDKNRPIEEAHRELIQELLNDMYKTS